MRQRCSAPSAHVASAQVEPPDPIPTRPICAMTSRPSEVSFVIRQRFAWQGGFLHNAICLALDRDRSTWRCQRVFCTLPDLPQEQYVLRSTKQDWSEVCIPVDLRPLGGRVSTHCVNVASTGADGVRLAAIEQRLTVPEQWYCQVHGLSLHPDAQTLLGYGWGYIERHTPRRHPGWAFSNRTQPTGGSTTVFPASSGLVAMLQWCTPAACSFMMSLMLLPRMQAVPKLCVRYGDDVGMQDPGLSKASNLPSSVAVDTDGRT